MWLLYGLLLSAGHTHNITVCPPQPLQKSVSRGHCQSFCTPDTYISGQRLREVSSGGKIWDSGVKSVESKFSTLFKFKITRRFFSTGGIKTPNFTVILIPPVEIFHFI